LAPFIADGAGVGDVEAAAGATLDSGFVDDVNAGRISVVDAVADSIAGRS